MKRIVVVLSILLSLSLSACSTNLTASLAPGATFGALGKTYVVRLEQDTRNLNHIIADQLSLMGYPAVAGERLDMPDDIDTLVTYQDNWQWDMSNYMIRIQIQFRDGRTRALIVSGESYRTSMARRSPDVMIRETLEEMMRKR